MGIHLISLVTLLTICVLAAAADQPLLVARWEFDEGAGEKLLDSSGNENHGVIRGARWVRSGETFALRFDGLDDYVDCGNGESLDLRGPLTLMAWIHPDQANAAEPGIVGKFFESYAITYYRGGCYMYISGGGNNAQGNARSGQWSHVAAVFDGTEMRLYLNGQLAQAERSKFPSANRGGNFLIGCILGDASNRDEALRNTAFFPGMIDSVHVYRGAIDQRQVIEHYNQQAAEKGQTPFDVSVLGRLSMRAFVYPQRSSVVVEVDRRWIELPAESTVTAELFTLDPERKVGQSAVKFEAGVERAETELPLAELPAGRYEFRVTAFDAQAKPLSTAVQGLTLPLPTATLPAPQERVAPPLPPAASPPEYQLELDQRGGFTVSVDGKTFAIESSFTYPQGGTNRLAAAPGEESMEPDWRVTSQRLEANRFQVTAEGASYRVRRELEVQPTRVLVRDTIQNLTEDVLGVRLSNYVNLHDLPDAKHVLAGNPTAFASQGSSGVGLIALDDLYSLRQRTVFADGLLAICDDHFGLDRGASHTVEWAVYPTGSNDYFDFINAVRRDYKLNGHVEGGLVLRSQWDPPSNELVRLKAVKYLCAFGLTRVEQNPTISLEGWEFMQYPHLCKRLAEAIGVVKQQYPQMKVMIHVAHSLYFTDKPKELFPDSIVVDENGNQPHYGPNTWQYYSSYISQDLYERGYRWWLFYPTMDNTFGREMIRAAEYMVDQIGTTGMWADGYIGGYVRDGFTYDRWDGNSVSIDPATNTVTRKKANVTYLSLPVLHAVARKISANGGALMTNGDPGPLSFQQDGLITSCETGGGDQQPIGALYLGRTVTPLGNPEAIKSERDVYYDILAKLDLGALYFWYGERDFVKDITLVSYMYPITFESIHAGTVRGRERIVTKRAGVYGWPGARSLHAVYRFDARGKLVPNVAVSTADADGVRTLVELAENESAAIVQIPLTATTSRPVNLRVHQYDRDAIRLTARGNGKTSLAIASGEFAVDTARRYLATVGDETTTLAPEDGVLNVPLALAGEPVTIQIAPAE